MPVFLDSDPLSAVGVGGVVLGGKKMPRFWSLLLIVAKTTKQNLQKNLQMGGVLFHFSSKLAYIWSRGSIPDDLMKKPKVATDVPGR